MAEGWTKSLLGAFVEPYSAGIEPNGLNLLAVQVMSEVGVDITAHRSKHIDSLAEIKFDLVVTVCDDAANHCPTPPRGTRVIHTPFDDPPRLAHNAKSAEEALSHYRRVRDEIRRLIPRLEAFLPSPQTDNR
jgi:arsenate reductase